MEKTANDQNRKPVGPTDYLANERTFLAWVRTSIAFMGFGFVIVKFALFTSQVTLALGKPQTDYPTSYSAAIGVIMVAIGALMAILAYIRFRTVEKQLDRNTYFSSHWLSLLVSLSIVIGAILLVLYLLPSVHF